MNNNFNAVADLEALFTKYRSEAERAWAEEAWQHLAADFDGALEKVQQYEPFNLRLGGHWYCPDFLHVLDNGQMVIVEVKGNREMKGFRASLIKIKEAAHKFPYWTFALAVGKRGEFELEIINP